MGAPFTRIAVVTASREVGADLTGTDADRVSGRVLHAHAGAT